LRGIIKGKEDVTDQKEIETEVCNYYSTLYNGGGRNLLLTLRISGSNSNLFFKKKISSKQFSNATSTKDWALTVSTEPP